MRKTVLLEDQEALTRGFAFIRSLVMDLDKQDRNSATVVGVSHCTWSRQVWDKVLCMILRW
jgi:hypothetical protein